MTKREAAELHNYNRWLRLNAKPKAKQVLVLPGDRIKASAIIAIAASLECERIHITGFNARQRRW